MSAGADAARDAWRTSLQGVWIGKGRDQARGLHVAMLLSTWREWILVERGQNFKAEFAIPEFPKADPPKYWVPINGTDRTVLEDAERGVFLYDVEVQLLVRARIVVEYKPDASIGRKVRRMVVLK